jgi:hypothetical protein
MSTRAFRMCVWLLRYRPVWIRCRYPSLRIINANVDRCYVWNQRYATLPILLWCSFPWWRDGPHLFPVLRWGSRRYRIWILAFRSMGPKDAHSRRICRRLVWCHHPSVVFLEYRPLSTGYLTALQSNSSVLLVSFSATGLRCVLPMGPFSQLRWHTHFGEAVSVVS